jgi:hypothetical protein
MARRRTIRKRVKRNSKKNKRITKHRNTKRRNTKRRNTKRRMKGNMRGGTDDGDPGDPSDFLSSVGAWWRGTGSGSGSGSHREPPPTKECEGVFRKATPEEQTKLDDLNKLHPSERTDDDFETLFPGECWAVGACGTGIYKIDSGQIHRDKNDRCKEAQGIYEELPPTKECEGVFRKATPEEQTKLDDLNKLKRSERTEAAATLFPGECWAVGACGAGIYKIDSGQFPADLNDRCKEAQEKEGLAREEAAAEVQEGLAREEAAAEVQARHAAVAAATRAKKEKALAAVRAKKKGRLAREKAAAEVQAGLAKEEESLRWPSESESAAVAAAGRAKKEEALASVRAKKEKLAHEKAAAEAAAVPEDDNTVELLEENQRHSGRNVSFFNDKLSTLNSDGEIIVMAETKDLGIKANFRMYSITIFSEGAFIHNLFKAVWRSTDDPEYPVMSGHDPHFVSAVLSLYVQEIIEKCYGQSNETLLQNIELIKEAIEWVAKVYDIKVIGDSSKHSSPLWDDDYAPLRYGKPLADWALDEYKKVWKKDAEEGFTRVFNECQNENVMYIACRYGILPLIKYLVNKHGFGANDICYEHRIFKLGTVPEGSVAEWNESEQRWAARNTATRRGTWAPKGVVYGPHPRDSIYTALDVCVREYHIKCVKWLISVGGDVGAGFGNIKVYLANPDPRKNAQNEEMKKLLGL